MASAIQSAERQFIERLKVRYEDRGFAFTVEPPADELPDFLKSYRPDAIARKGGRNEIIEVKRRPRGTTETALRHIRQLFEGHPDWHLRVFYLGDDPLVRIEIGAAEPEMIREREGEIRSLTDQGHLGAAFVLAWSLLEASLRALEGVATRPERIDTLVQTLAMRGYIEPDTERRIRPLIDLRHRIVHGDFTADPSAVDIETILSAIGETLSASVS